MLINISTKVTSTETEFLQKFPNIAFPVQIPYEDFGYKVIIPSNPPSYDPLTQTLQEVAPVLSKKNYIQTFQIVPLDAETIATNSANKIAMDAKMVSFKVNQLWKAADSYVESYISGIAIGLLTIGVVQAKPKALAVVAWTSSIWDEYYTRKAVVTADSTLNLDFSSFGSIPHSIPELRTELGM
jgi:hypothetical protein